MFPACLLKISITAISIAKLPIVYGATYTKNPTRKLGRLCAYLHPKRKEKGGGENQEINGAVS
jgi:hypothetical protein